jgi:hypothetical protein
VNLTKTVYDIELRSVKSCLHHLQSVDLAELAACAQAYGNSSDSHLIAAVRACLAGLPPIHP